MDEYQQAKMKSLYKTDDPVGFFKNHAVKFLSIHNVEISGIHWEKFQWQLLWELHR